MKKLLLILSLILTANIIFAQTDTVVVKIPAGGSVNLSNYFTKGQIDSINAGYYTKSQVDSIFALSSTHLSEGTNVTITGSGTSGDPFVINSTGGGGGTVTNVAALTLGTTGTDLTSTVANGTTTPVITLNVPTASASNRGALSSTDWSTFNGKENSLGNPSTSGYVLSSTTGGTRSWITNQTNIVLPRGLGNRGTSTNDTLFTKAHVATYTSASSINIDADTTDRVWVTALTSGTTINTPTGVAYYDGQILTLLIRDNGTPQTLSFGSGFSFSSDKPAPTTTISGKLFRMVFERDGVDNTWLNIEQLNNFP